MQAILEAYKLKKEAEREEQGGLAGLRAAKLRPKSAGGGRPRPRPNTIHVETGREVKLKTG